MSQTECRWTGERWVTAAHVRACRDSTCAGCKPCPEIHCAMRGRCERHVRPPLITCPRCVGQVRRDLAAIELLAFDALTAAAVTGDVDHEGVNLAGPYGRLGAYMADVAEHPTDLKPEHHPGVVLGTWATIVRNTYGPSTTFAPTITRSRSYLDAQLDTFAQDGDHAAVFDLFAAHVRRCRTHLEEVIGNSRAVEHGAPCPTCRAQHPDQPAPRLVKDWFTHEHPIDWQPGDRCVGCDILDTWRCPACGTEWSEADYRLRVDSDYLEHALALTASQIEQVHGIKASTLRQWHVRGHVEKRGRNAAGQQLYDVRQALDHDSKAGA